MPTYEYHCPGCDRNFDVVQSFTDDPLEACPTCASPVRKVFGSVGIVFKGSGFYKTDNRSGGASKAAPAGSAGAAPATTPAAGATGGETKAEKSAPSAPSDTTAKPAPAAAATSPGGATTAS